MLDKLRKSPTIIAVVGTAFAYWLAYIFQSSYLRRFGVSAYEVDVNINNLVIALVVLILALLAIDSTADLYRQFMQNVGSNKPIHRYIRSVTRNVLACALVIVLLYSLEVQNLGVVAIGFAFIITLFAAEPLPYIKRKSSFPEAVSRMYAKKDAADRPKGYASYTERFIDYIAGGFFLLVIASVSGYIYAQSTSTLYVIKSDGPTRQLLILKNADTIVTRNYNVDKKTFEPGYTVKKVQDQLTLNEKVQIK